MRRPLFSVSASFFYYRSAFRFICVQSDASRHVLLGGGHAVLGLARAYACRRVHAGFRHADRASSPAVRTTKAACPARRGQGRLTSSRDIDTPTRPDGSSSSSAYSASSLPSFFIRASMLCYNCDTLAFFPHPSLHPPATFVLFVLLSCKPATHTVHCWMSSLIRPFFSSISSTAVRAGLIPMLN